MAEQPRELDKELDSLKSWIAGRVVELVKLMKRKSWKRTQLMKCLFTYMICTVYGIFQIVHNRNFELILNFSHIGCKKKL